MVRVIGNIGTRINGTLHIKPSAPFVGVEAGYRAYPVFDGLVDIDIAPTPRGAFYLVDFQPEGSFSNPTPQERWTIPPQAEISLDLLRFPRQKRTPATLPTQGNAFAQIETNLLRQECAQLHDDVDTLKTSLMNSLEEIMVAEQKLQSARAEVAELKTKLYLMECPHEKIVEKVVEIPVVERIANKELVRENETLFAMVEDLRAENNRLMEMLTKAIANGVMPPAEPVNVAPRKVPNPSSSPAERLDFLLRQKEGLNGKY